MVKWHTNRDIWQHLQQQFNISLPLRELFFVASKIHNDFAFEKLNDPEEPHDSFSVRHIGFYSRKVREGAFLSFAARWVTVICATASKTREEFIATPHIEKKDVPQSWRNVLLTCVSSAY